MQEAVRKDVERAFGVLQARFHIVSSPCRLWEQTDMKTVMKACLILHNMIIEDEKAADLDEAANDPLFPPNFVPHARLRQFISYEIRNEAAYHRLRTDLIEHLWSHRQYI